MGHMISTKKKEDQKGFRPRRMYLPDIPVGLVMERKADEVEEVDRLDVLRNDLRTTMGKFDSLVAERMDEFDRKAAFLGSVQRGYIDSNKRGVPALKETKGSPGDEKIVDDEEIYMLRQMKTLGGAAVSITDEITSALKDRSSALKSGEKKLEIVVPTPMIRLRLHQFLQKEDAQVVKELLLSHVLASRQLYLSSLYAMLGGHNLLKADVNFHVFNLWMKDAVGDRLNIEVKKIIYDYGGPVNPQGMPYTFTMSTYYAGLPNDYATLVDGRHGHPGAGTNHSTNEWMQAEFSTDVRPTKVILSEPTYGFFATDGWTGGGYLAPTAIVMPREDYKGEPAPNCTRTFGHEGANWVVIGTFDDRLDVGGEQVVIPLSLPPGSSSRRFRLCAKPPSAHNRWLATGTFIFE
ncbi:hypothetical protein AAMO2058_000321700 [Amorphochlora amoebiformis]